MLWALFALIIPIVVHLFNFRKHKLLPFSNIELLKNIQQQTNQTRKIKHLVVLALRMLAIASLIFAFAQPYTPTSNTISADTKNLISVYIDNSMSMQLRGAEMSLLDEAKQKAISLAQSFGLNNRYVLLTNDFLPQHQRSLSANDFLAEVEQIRNGAPPALFSDVILRNKAIRQSEQFKEKLLFVFSDFQKSMANATQSASDSSVNLFLVPVQSSMQNNLFIDSCWFETPVIRPGMNTAITVRIKNGGNEAAIGIPISLIINNEQKAVANADIEAGNAVEVSMQFTATQTGFQKAVISILDFPIVFDDELSFSFNIQQKIKVLEIFESKGNKGIYQLFGDDEAVAFESKQRQNIDIQSLTDFNFIILNELDDMSSGFQQRLTDFVSRGGSIAIIPSEKLSDAYNQLVTPFGFSFQAIGDTAKTRVFSLETTHALFQDVFIKIPENPDFPSVFKHYFMRFSPQSTVRSIIQLPNGNAFLAAGNKNNGKVYAFAVPFQASWTDFQQNNLFVPVFYRMALMSAQPQDLYFTLGKRIALEAAFSNEEKSGLLKLRSFSSDFEVIPQHLVINGKQEVVFDAIIPAAGHYGLFQNDTLKRVLAWNDDRKESLFTFLNTAELKNAYKPPSFKTVQVLQSNQFNMKDALNEFVASGKLFAIFIIFALMFLLAEVLLLRF